VGEVAAEKVMARGQGVGSMQAALLDELQLLDSSSFERRVKLEVTQW
jgi:hydroxyethylthiazole kinase